VFHNRKYFVLSAGVSPEQRHLIWIVSGQLGDDAREISVNGNSREELALPAARAEKRTRP